MKNKFHIAVYKNSENVHLKLFGDFDDSSVTELNRSLEHFSQDTNKIFVHTESLDNVEPIGQKIFHDEIQTGKGNLIFTGRHASVFKPALME